VHNSTPPALGSNAFSGTHSSLCVYVPQGSLTAYKVSSYWSSFCLCGSAGTNVLWRLCDDVLTISGSGAMEDYGGSSTPWYSVRSYITSAVVEGNVTSIGNSAFIDCGNLTSVTIGNSVISIGQQAFLNCTNLTEVTLGNSVASIGNYAFYYCTSLISATVHNPTPPAIGGNTFSGTHTNFCVYVPPGTLAAYRAAGGWSALTCIRGGIYTVTFNAMDGSEVFTQTVQEGNFAAEPDPAPTRYSFTFGGWYADTSNWSNAAWNFSVNTVTSDTTLYAKWIVGYAVTFNAMGGSAVPTQAVLYGNFAAKPNPAPTRAGYTLAGWYVDTTNSNPTWNFAVNTITQDTTLFAGWAKVGNIQGCENTEFTISIPFRGLPYTVTYRWYREGQLIENSQDEITPDKEPKITYIIPQSAAIGVNVVFYFEYKLNDDCPSCWTRSPSKYSISFMPQQ